MCVLKFSQDSYELCRLRTGITSFMNIETEAQDLPSLAQVKVRETHITTQVSYPALQKLCTGQSRWQEDVVWNVQILN